MFKSIYSRDNGEPWGHTGMTTKTWQTIAVHRVPIGDLIATQPGILLAPLAADWDQEPVGGDPVPHVIAWDGNLYLEDGHHRVARAALQGMTHVAARVLHL